MKIFNLVEIKKVEKEAKAMTAEGYDPDGVVPEDETEVKEKKKKKGFGKKLLVGVGALGTAAIAVGTVLKRSSGSDPDEVEDEGDDFDQEAPFEAADEPEID